MTKPVPHVSVSIDSNNHERFITSVLELDMLMDNFELLVAGDAPAYRTLENISLHRYGLIKR
jgi:hypothetical protein